MALFDRSNYDRDFGDRWGGSPEYGGARRGGGFMGAVRRGLDRAFDGGDERGRHMGGFGHHPGMSAGMGNGEWRRDYDRDFGARDDYRFRGTGDFSDTGRGGGLGYRGTEPGWSTAYNYDRDFNYGRSWAGGGYDRDFGARRGMEADGRMGYDRDFGMDRDRAGWRGRDQTDNGDPFGDRQGRTPIRVMRGGFDAREPGRGDWGRGDRPNRGDAPYDREYRGWNQGIGDDPAYNASDFRRNRNRF